MKIAAPAPTDLAGKVGVALSARPLPLRLMLARTDATAVAAADIWASSAFRPIRERNPAPCFIETDSHTFARPGDEEKLREAVLAGLRES